MFIVADLVSLSLAILGGIVIPRPEVYFCSRFNIICLICFHLIAYFYLMSKLYVRMQAFILSHYQLSKGHKKTHLKISDSLLATVQGPRLNAIC